MLASQDTDLRGYCARILGWSAERTGAVEHALRSIHLSTTYRVGLVLLGETDLVPIAHALHRRTFGIHRPFIVCDWRRRDTRASVRSPPNQGNGAAAFRAARGGSLCVRVQRLPDDFSTVVALVRDSAACVQLIVCADGRYETHPFLALPVPIRVPSLRTRVSELPRIVDAYAADAIAALGARDVPFTDHDRQWVLEHCPLTLPEIEKATLRLVALRMSKNRTRAAERLGMAPVSLARWIGRRQFPPMLPER